MIAVDNKFGLKYFAGDPEKILNKKFESLIGYNNEKEKIETFTKARLERKLREIGYNTNFYYPLPDYKMPNVIFSEKQLPRYTSIDKYHPYHQENSTLLFNEIDVFREILKNDKDMFPFFANSFLVEAAKEDVVPEFKYISFNNLRKEKYQLITKIAETYVEKQIVSKASQKHYNNIKENIKILEDQGIKMLDHVDEQGTIKSKYQKQKYMLNNILAELLEKNDIQEFERLMDKYIELLNKTSYSEENYSNTVFGKYNIENKENVDIQKMHFLKNGFWDMTFKNCFYIDNEFIFFDQEWKEENLPAEYILYRSIFYTISLRRFVKIEDLYEKYNLTPYIELFTRLDNAIQEEIRDDETWKFYLQGNIINLEETMQELKNVETRSKAQQGAIDNLQTQLDALQAEYNKTKDEYLKTKHDFESYKQSIENKLLMKIYRKIKK